MSEKEIENGQDEEGRDEGLTDDTEEDAEEATNVIVAIGSDSESEDDIEFVPAAISFTFNSLLILQNKSNCES